MATYLFGDANSFASQTPQSGANGVIALNYSTISADYTFPSGFNGESRGPVIIADGVTVTITSGCEWTVT